VLYRFGGVYLDIDAHAAWPLGLAIDPDLDELYVLHRGGKLSNYFIASVQENPNLALVIDAVLVLN
jgi:mannosyltransferase OCH1-like enzyme